MSSLEHTFAPEEIMAFVDGELSLAEMRSVESHLRDCVECAALAESFRTTSQWMARWDVEAMPESVDRAVHGVTVGRGERQNAHRGSRRFGLRIWQLWTGGALAAAVFAVCIVLVSPHPASHGHAFINPPVQEQVTMADKLPSPEPAPSSVVGLMKSMPVVRPEPARLSSTSSGTYASTTGGGQLSEQKLPQTTPPMIARTASLVVAVKNLDASRAALEQILARERGYVAQLTAGNAEDAPPTFQASLRVPAEDLQSALRELKALGRTVTESQSGEEVTQQHADLAARLQNARETEGRYRAILAQHTGKVQDILDVEEHISEVRGEIEQMEAEQKALDHRVDFATVDVQLTEEYKARLNAPETSVSTQMHNAFVGGYRHVAETLLGLVLFGEEYTPAIGLWLLILGVPVFMLVRRYRRIQRRVS